MKFLLITALILIVLIVYSFAAYSGLHLYIKIQCFDGPGAATTAITAKNSQLKLAKVIDGLEAGKVLFSRRFQVNGEILLDEKIYYEGKVAEVSGLVGELKGETVIIESLKVDVSKCFYRENQEILMKEASISGDFTLQLDKDYYYPGQGQGNTVKILTVRISQPKLKQYILDHCRFRKRKTSEKDIRKEMTEEM